MATVSSLSKQVFNVLLESKYHFLVVLVVKHPPTTSAEVPGSTPGHG